MGYQWRRFDRRNIKRRIRLRMESIRIFELEKYAQLVVQDATEQIALDCLLRVTVTRFFRDRRLWPELGALIAQTGKDLVTGDILGIWSAGCAGGEEPFSLAMLLEEMEKSGRLDQPWSILTYNTDEIQRNVLDRIRDCLLEPGYLVIGRTEKIPEGTEFEEVTKCIYRKT